jgi:hypothetical protein
MNDKSISTEILVQASYQGSTCPHTTCSFLWSTPTVSYGLSASIAEEFCRLGRNFSKDLLGTIRFLTSDDDQLNS